MNPWCCSRLYNWLQRRIQNTNTVTNASYCKNDEYLRWLHYPNLFISPVSQCIQFIYLSSTIVAMINGYNECLRSVTFSHSALSSIWGLSGLTFVQMFADVAALSASLFLPLNVNGRPNFLHCYSISMTWNFRQMLLEEVNNDCHVFQTETHFTLN